MSQVEFRFYGTLNDFLPAVARQRPTIYAFDQRVSVKDAIESLGVPHTEVDLLVLNGAPAPFSRHLAGGDRVAAYPRFRQIDVAALSLVRPPALDEPRFVLDAHLGRLAAYMRLAGLDCLYGNDWDDAHLARLSSDEKRILLTRDAALLKRAIVEYGYWMRETDPRRQLTEVFAHFDLASHVRAFSRCLRCNAPLEPVAKSEIVNQLQPRTRECFEEFWRCRGCARVYWKGGHVARMKALLSTVAAGNSQFSNATEDPSEF